jgi:hypothetical protein
MIKSNANHFVEYLELKKCQHSEKWMYCFKARKDMSIHKVLGDSAPLSSKQSICMKELVRLPALLCIVFVKKPQYKSYTYACIENYEWNVKEICGWIENAGNGIWRAKPESGHVGFCDGQKWRWGRFSPRTSVSPANLHYICFSTIIFTISRGWHNRPGVAAVPIASQTRIKKKMECGCDS